MIQWLGWFASNHPDFLVTGTFPNPGPYGGLLAVSFVATLWLLRRTTQINILLWGILFMLLIMLIVSNSRASWLAVLVGVIALFPKFYRGLTRKIALVAIMGIVIGCLYCLRSGSADARLLIWQVCVDLIEKAPFLGCGIGNFSLYYMNAQADYFAMHPHSELYLVANNNYQAFNEFLHVFVEQGIVGFILLLWIIFTCRSSSYFILMLVWFVFSVFSYPADCALLMVVLVLCIALCAENSPVWNMKYPGNMYELFYFDRDGWRSLGRQNGDKFYLEYKNVPGNALYWLRNLTTGVEERIFTSVDGMIIFW